jgi:hypothetical protein
VKKIVIVTLALVAILSIGTLLSIVIATPSIQHGIASGATALVQFLNNVPAEYYAVILASLPFSFIVALVKSVAVRRWDAMPSETKMFLTNFGGLIVMAFGAYLSTTPSQDPVAAIAALVGVTTAIQQPFFYKVVKPVVANFWANWEKGGQLNDDMRSAAIPPSGLPIEK